MRFVDDIFLLADAEVKAKIELQPPGGVDPGDMEDTAGCSAQRTARESEASHLIFGDAELWGADVLGSMDLEAPIPGIADTWWRQAETLSP